MNKELLKNVLDIIRQTRRISFPFYGNVEVAGKKAERACEVVTKIDVEIEEFLSREFTIIEPSIGFVGEELGGDRTLNKFWLVDPVDGTGHFVRGLPFCTTMVALIDNGQVVFGAIYDFVNDCLYHAVKGEGAFKNREKILVSDRNIKDSYLCWNTILDDEEKRKLHFRLREKTILFKTISAGWEFAMIAEGKLDGMVCFSPYGGDYDFAPGSLLVSEAGGIVKNIGSDSYDYTNLDFIASNKEIYETLTEGEDALFPII